MKKILIFILIIISIGLSAEYIHNLDDVSRRAQNHLISVLSNVQSNYAYPESAVRFWNYILAADTTSVASGTSIVDSLGTTGITTQAVGNTLVFTAGGVEIATMDSLGLHLTVLYADNATIDALTATTGIIKTDSTQVATNLFHLVVPDNAVDGTHYSMSFIGADTTQIMKFDLVANGDGVGGIYSDSTRVDVFGDLHVENYFSTGNPRAGAYTDPDSTFTIVIGTADTWQPITATFINRGTGWTASGDSIVYLGEMADMYIGGSPSLYTSNNCNVIYGLKINGVIDEAFTTARDYELNKAGGIPVRMLAEDIPTNASFQWVVQSDVTTTITLLSFKTTAELIP